MPERRLPRAQRPSHRAPAAAASAAVWRLEALAALDLLGPRLRVLWAVALPRLLLLPRVPPHRVEVPRPRPVEELPLLLRALVPRSPTMRRGRLWTKSPRLPATKKLQFLARAE